VIALVALARVIERRLRTSAAVQRAARGAMARLARSSKNARAFVRLRIMPII
jgi:hypothetical protein